MRGVLRTQLRPKSGDKPAFLTASRWHCVTLQTLSSNVQLGKLAVRKEGLPPLFPARVGRIVSRFPAESICAAILLVMGLTLFSVAAQKTITNDEVVHIPSGYQYARAGKFNLNPEHPPLVKMLAGLPLLPLKLKPPAVTASANQDWGQRTLNSAMDFWRLNRDRYIAIYLLARLPVILVTIGLGVLIFISGRQLFGPRAAVFAVALFSLEPTMLGHGWIVHTDIAGALGYLLFFFLLHDFCRAPTFSRSVWLGLGAGFALLTKFSMIILLPIFLLGMVYVFWRAPRLGLSRSRLALRCGLAILILIVSINAAYLFQHPRLPPADALWLSGAIPALSNRATMAMQVLSKIVPTYYLFGIYTVIVHNRFGHPAGLLGNYSMSGWWYYFPVAFALKTTIPFLLLSVSSLAWALWRVIGKGEKQLLALLLPIALYLTFSMTSHINIGIRHIAPLFPFLFLLGGVGLDRLLQVTWRPGLARVLVICLLGWMVVDAVRAYPNYMSFMNPLTLGRPGWQMLSDSNVEWGQDVGALAKYLRAHGETKVSGALSGGWATLDLYGIQLVEFAPSDINSARTRYVAIGAGFLNGSTVPGGLRDVSDQVISEEQRQNYFAAYRTLTPEAVFGNSIYLYRAP